MVNLLFNTSNPELHLSQEHVAKAVEYWLNQMVLKTPCNVISIKSTGTRGDVTFEVLLQEIATDIYVSE